MIKFEINGVDPIFVQVAFYIEECVIKGIYKEEDKIPSTTEFSTTYKINPATVLKGFNLLESNLILYKKRGIGVFVKEGAVKLIVSRRKEEFEINYVDNLVKEADNLGISKNELLNMINSKYSEK